MALQHFALAQFAQLIELAAAHKVIAALALNHLLEHLLAVLALPVLGQRIQLCPLHGGIAHKPHHLGQQSAGWWGFFLAHGDDGYGGEEATQDTACLNPRTSLLEFTALLGFQRQRGRGGAIRRPTPMGSPVSSQ